jgi:hypothetical protein
MRPAPLISMILISALLLTFATQAEAQKKHKDPVQHEYLIQEFAQINAKLTQLADRLSAVETELGRQKQQQSELIAELRNAENILKTTDTSLSSFRLGTQQELFGLKTDLTQVRQDLAALADWLKKSATAAQPPRETSKAASETSPMEGYITAVGDKEVTINVGSSAGVKPGARFHVYRATDPKVQIGVVEVVEVIDANNSRAKIIFSKPDIRFEFSDIVRPE